jgi:tRNA(Ile)-lysidine synthetase-like protein
VPSDRPIFAERSGLPIRSDAAARRIVAAWRRLTASDRWSTARTTDPDRRTLIACSGGADSAALAICLASASAGARRSLVLGHVLHDLRPAAPALDDRDRTRELADRLGVSFLEREVRVGAQPGNAEANARKARYAALVDMASEAHCSFIATAHHADDQLETVLMRLVRGSGLRGLAGVYASRRVGAGITLVRPMLVATRADSVRICSLARYVPATDATNDDTTRLRAALRARVLPVLRELNPGVAAHSVELASAARAAQTLVRASARRLVHSDTANPHGAHEAWLDVRGLRDAGKLVAAEAILIAARRATGQRSLSIPRPALDSMVRAMWQGQPRMRRFTVPFEGGALVGTLSFERFTWRTWRET